MTTILLILVFFVLDIFGIIFGNLILNNNFVITDGEYTYNDLFYSADNNKDYYRFKKMYYESREKINSVDSILVLNFDKEKNGNIYSNYIGASTFLEMYEAFMQNKKIYMYNDYPNNMLYDQIKGFNPIIINGDLKKIIINS